MKTIDKEYKMNKAKFELMGDDGQGKKLWKVGKSFAQSVHNDNGEVIDINTDIEGWGGGRPAGKRQIIDLAFYLGK
jgi:hypothetical protein